MNDSSPKDARIRELEFLSRVERAGVVSTLNDGLLTNDLQKQMIVHLIHEGHLNGVDTFPLGLLGWPSKSGAKTRDEVEEWKWSAISSVLDGQQVALQLSHKGRVRISELRDELRAGKFRDPSGLMWSVRHLDRDLIVAVLEASTAAPVSFAMLDMNGLEAINDTHGHDAGDAAITTYLQVVATLTGEGIDAYRGDSSDEVYLILRATTPEQAHKTLGQILARLEQERVTFEGQAVANRLTACCGITTTSDPISSATALRREGDDRLYRAKAKSKSGADRSSVLVDASGEQIIPLP